jgi:8-oxo-dGTP pyrophosphatase MutT (NUDIX family)
VTVLVQAGGPGSGRYPKGSGESPYTRGNSVPRFFAKLKPLNKTWSRHPNWHQQGYGAILVNKQGQFLLREPKNHFDDYVWTWPKGGMKHKFEHPVDTAVRETQEETGYHARLFDSLPGNYRSGSGSNSNFFLGKAVDYEPSSMDKETASTRWADYDEAKQLIGESKNKYGRMRDLAILETAHNYLRKPQS